jgi:hypothetical protein
METPERDESLDALADFHKRMTEQMQPFIEFQKRIQSTLEPLQRQLKQFSSIGDSARQSLEKITEPLREMGERLAEIERQKERLICIGVLPHSSTPFELLDLTADVAALRQSVKKFYEDNWPDISSAIATRVDAYNIDDEAKATLREALLSHQYGHYRSVCRVLFPEIERVVRVELCEGKLGTIYVHELMDGTTDKIYLSDLEPHGVFALALFDRLTDHLYKSIKTEEDRKRFEADPVPNRHAAIHGFIVYNSFWNALNVIFMADFAFQIVSLAKKTSHAERQKIQISAVEG